MCWTSTKLFNFEFIEQKYGIEIPKRILTLEGIWIIYQKIGSHLKDPKMPKRSAYFIPGVRFGPPLINFYLFPNIERLGAETTCTRHQTGDLRALQVLHLGQDAADPGPVQARFHVKWTNASWNGNWSKTTAQITCCSIKTLTFICCRQYIEGRGSSLTWTRVRAIVNCRIQGCSLSGWLHWKSCYRVEELYDVLYQLWLAIV